MALLLFGFAWREAAVVRRLRRGGIHTRGVVVDNRQLADDDGHIWVPVIVCGGLAPDRKQVAPDA
ncbi:hypothetical protein [Streptomyces lydicus]|uniref:hypothetical protein n=1 Tax=Streptomyces lydicus TaxID=47763 RepID=UPI00378DB9E6